MAQAVSKIGGVGIGGIFHMGKLQIFCIAEDVAVRCFQKRSYDHAAGITGYLPHTAEHAVTAPKQSHQHRFLLVVCMVGGEDAGCTASFRQIAQCFIPKPPCRFLRRFS